jgi:hypothetical protein
MDITDGSINISRCKNNKNGENDTKFQHGGGGRKYWVPCVDKFLKG